MCADFIDEQYRNFVLKPVMSPTAVNSAQGVMLIEPNGRQVLDFVSGFGVMALGYNNPYTQQVKEAIIKQMDRIWHMPYYLCQCEPAAVLSEKLAAISPQQLCKTFFCNSGSEAIEGSIRIIRKAKKRYELVAPQQSFFGRTMGAASLTGLSEAKSGAGPLLPGVHHIPAPYCLRCSLNHQYPGCNLACAQYLNDYLEFGTDGAVAALFFEPIFGDVGVIVPPDGYFEKISSICRKHDIALVIDETLTGFGRTGTMFASEQFNLDPDIMVTGKALGGGLPLGAITVSHSVAETFAFKDFSSSLGGNILACAAALATIKVIEEENICQKVKVDGEYFIAQLRGLQKDHSLIGDIRGKGFLIGIEIVSPVDGKPDPPAALQIKDLLLEKGILITIYGKSTIRLTPPLIIERQHIDFFLSVLADIIPSVRRTG